MLSARNIQGGEIKFDNFRLISEEDFALEHRRTQVTANDVLLTIVGTIGRVAVVPKNAPEFSLQRSVAVLKPTAAVTSKYLAYTLESPRTQQKFLESAKGTAQKGVYLRTLGELEVDLAPLPEQARIADQLDTLLARVNACNDHLNVIPGILKRFRKAVLMHAASGKLSQDWRDMQPNAVPEWKTLRVKDVGRVQLGRQRAPKFHAGKHMRPYLRVQNVFEARLDLSDVMEMDFAPADFERYQLHPGDILLNEGQSPEYLGRPALYQGELPGACFTNTLIRFQAGSLLLPKFALTVFRNHMHSGRYVQEGKITTNLAHLGAGRFADVEFPLPSLKEQEEIVRRTEELLGIADRIEARYTAMRLHAQRLASQVLAKAFRGELVEQDPQDEPASVLLQRLAVSQPAKAAAPRGRPRAPAKPQPSAADSQLTDWASLPDGAWAAPADPDGHATTVGLTAVLRAWGAPVPERTARLATLLCQQPHLFAPVLPMAQARLWSRLVGDAAAPLPAQVARLQPASNRPWGRALHGMRMRGDLVEAGTGDDVTWALGPGAAAIDTAGWPDGRAGFVVAHLRVHGLASILPALAPAEQAFVDARAA
jgi:type I restriction enzyme S subunit